MVLGGPQGPLFSMIGGFQPLAFQPAYQQEVSVRRGGGKGRRPWIAYGEQKRPKLNARIEEILDEVSAEMLYQEVVDTAPQPVVAKAREIIAPYKEAKTVDWLALE